MSESALIVLARAIHVLSGVIWSGGTFVLAIAVVPLFVRHGAEGAGRWLGMVFARAGALMGASAGLTVLSGLYLFATLHPHDDSASGVILKTGAATALLAGALGGLVSRRAGHKLLQLHRASSPQAANSPDTARQLAALRMRATVSERAAAALLGITVLAMATFRYASALV